MTTITTMPEDMKVKFSENISENFCCTDDNLPSVRRLSKGHISNILGTILYVKLKLKTLVVGNIELTKRQYLHRNTTASTPTTTTSNTIIIIATTTNAS